MRKVILGLFLSIAVFAMTACSSSATSDGDKIQNENIEIQDDEVTYNQDDEVTYKELTDPRGKTLKSTATGESHPQIVETLYETDDVVVADYVPTEMGYAVDPTGLTDSTGGIQKALYDCYYAGGGTVYLPAGNYAISDTIRIPPYVSLRGDWQDPEEGNEYGTIISVWMEGADYEGAGAFELTGCSGVIGLTVYYPLQSLEKIVPYPYTFYVEENSVDRMLMTIEKVTIINGYRGIGTSKALTHEQLKVDNLRGTFLLEGLSIYYSSEVGSVSNTIISNKYWKEASADCMNAAPAKMLDAYTKQYVTGMQIGDLDWSTFYHISIDQCAIGMKSTKGSRNDLSATFYDLDITNCTQGILFEGTEERWGVCVANSHIEGGITNNGKGKVKLCSVDIEGDMVGIEEDSFIVDEESDLSKYEMNYNAGYVKPVNNLWIAELPKGLDTDASSKLQTMLDQAGEKGGIVYVPGGLYCFKSPLTVPAGVELRGTSSVPTRESDGLTGTNEASIGTLFYCYYGDDASNRKEDQAFITLSGENAGVNGIRIMYPENSSANGDYNSSYTVRGTAAGVYIVNSMIAGSAYGIDFRGCDSHYVEGIMTTCYFNAFLLGGKGGTIRDSLQNGTVMQRTKQSGLVNWITAANLYESLLDTLTRVKCDYIIVEGAEGETLCNVFIFGGKTLITNNDSKNTFVMNVATDRTGEGSPMLIMSGGSLVAVNMMRSYGYSYDYLGGNMKLYNRITANEVGERTLERSE